MSKKETIYGLPSDAEAQKAIKSNINEIVDATVRIDSEKDLIANILEVAEEKYGVDKKFVKDQAALRYSELYDEAKKQKSIEKASEALDTYRAMFD